MARRARPALKVKWARGARADQQSIWLFLAERNTDYADRVEARIEERIETLAQLPRLGRPFAATGRRLLSVTDIQYVVEYEVQDEEDVVRVLSIWSPRQNREQP